MHRTFLMASTIAALALGSATAFAQGQASGGQSGTAGPSSSSSSQGAASTSAPKPPMTQDKVRQVMKDAGFTGVNIVDAAYLVQATTKDGDPIVVLVNAPMMNQAAASTGTAGTSGSSKGGSSGTAGTSGSGTGGAAAPKQ